MADPSFENVVCRLYAEPAPFEDQTAFTSAVQRRLERGWARRRVLIGAAGVSGGLIAAAQVVGANLIGRAASVTQAADTRAHNVAGELLARSEALLGPYLPPIGGEALWMVAGLAATGVALAAARLMEAF